MGRAAKVCKRTKKTESSAQAHAKAVAEPEPGVARKKAGMKSKAGRGGARGHVLGGADYVDIMMGGRRRARAEMEKLPPPEE